MSVSMKGGTSGNRENALPKVSVAFDSQAPQNTAGSGGMSAAIKLSPCKDNRHIADGNPQMPTGGTPDDSAT